MKVYTMSEALDKLNISRHDLELLVDLNMISVIVEDGKYFFTEGFIKEYLDNKEKRSYKNRYIPRCDIEMIINDKYEEDLTDKDK